MTLLLILKLTVTPLLVAGASLAARRWGPRVGGILIGFPVMTGPISVFLALEQGLPFAAEASVGILLALIAICSFCLAYAEASRHWGWPGSLMVATTVFAVTSVPLGNLGVGVLGSGLLAYLALIGGLAAIGRPQALANLSRIPWWDLWLRMIASGSLVAMITLVADQLGPRLSGLAGTYPVISTVVVSFTHHQWGRQAALAILRGMMLSLISFVSTFIVVGLLLTELGLVATYLLACLAGALTSLVVLMFDRRLASSRPPITKTLG